MDQGFEVWKEYGFAGLFVFVALTAIVVLWYEMRAARKETGEARKDTLEALKTVTEALATATASQERVSSTQEAATRRIDENTKATNELIVYMKARDQFGGSSGIRRAER